MRRRSTTIQAESYEEFLEISQATSPDKNINPQLQNLKKIHQFVSEDSYELDHEYISTLSSKKEEFSDFDFDFDSHQSRRPLSEVTHQPKDKSKSPIRTCEILEKLPQKTTIKKIMMIGAPQTGRHSIIGSLFHEVKQAKKDIRNSLDLVMKSRIIDSNEDKFKFWIHDPTDEKLDPLMTVYLKSIKTYLFVYNYCDKESFYTLDSAIRRTMAKVEKENFFGILVGNGQDRAGKREIDESQGLELKEKYGLHHYIEMDRFDESSLQKIRNLLF